VADGLNHRVNVSTVRHTATQTPTSNRSGRISHVRVTLPEIAWHRGPCRSTRRRAEDLLFTCDEPRHRLGDSLRAEARSWCADDNRPADWSERV
jgi:hypothetical protein